MWSKLSNYRDVALLFFRVTFGSFFIYLLIIGLMVWRPEGLLVRRQAA